MRNVLRMFAWLRVLSCLWLCGVVSAHADGLTQLRQFWRHTQTLEGRFVQSVTNASGGKRDSSGDFSIQRPAKFRWRYEKPHAQLLVSDGEILNSFDPDLKQATRNRLSTRLGDTPAALLAGADIEKHFNLTAVGKAEGLDIVDALPKSDAGSFARVRLGLSKNLPRLMEIHDRFGQVTTLGLFALKPNGQLSPTLFQFFPPQGVDVLDDTTLPHPRSSNIR